MLSLQVLWLQLEEPLQVACTYGHAGVVQQLLKCRQNTGSQFLDFADALYGNTALSMAAIHDHVDCMELLVKAGADIRKANHKGTRPVSALIHMHYRELKSSSSPKFKKLLVL